MAQLNSSQGKESGLVNFNPQLPLSHGGNFNWWMKTPEGSFSCLFMVWNMQSVHNYPELFRFFLRSLETYFACLVKKKWPFYKKYFTEILWYQCNFLPQASAELESITECTHPWGTPFPYLLLSPMFYFKESTYKFWLLYLSHRHFYSCLQESF